jgi:hypothetical protein
MVGHIEWVEPLAIKGDEFIRGHAAEVPGAKVCLCAGLVLKESSRFGGSIRAGGITGIYLIKKTGWLLLKPQGGDRYAASDTNWPLSIHDYEAIMKRLKSLIQVD